MLRNSLWSKTGRCIVTLIDFNVEIEIFSKTRFLFALFLMYSSSLSVHRCIRVLHCSKQCYSSSTPRPFSSCDVFTFTSSTDGVQKKSLSAKSANMEDFQVFECVYWEETSRAKGRCELEHCPDAASRLCSSRDSAASSARIVALSLC